MIYTPMTIKATKIAYDAHHGQVDKGGLPYILHPVHLAEQMTDEICCTVALLHDVAEDTAITLDDLANEFPADVIDALALLTHEKDTDYYEYVAKIKSNPVAVAVNLADLSHNSDETRLVCSGFSEEIRDYFRNKYAKATKILMED